MNTSPQGRPEQGWTIRRCSPEAQPHVIDRVPEEFDDQSESADGQVALYLVKFIGGICLALFCAWLISGGPGPDALDALLDFLESISA